MHTLDIQNFEAIYRVGFKWFLNARMSVAQNVQYKINVDVILPCPTVVIRNAWFHAEKVRKCLVEEMKSVIDEQVSATLTAGMTIEDCTKTSC